MARRVGEHDTLYGSVTAADIAEALAEQQFADREAEDRAARADQAGRRVRGDRQDPPRRAGARQSEGRRRSAPPRSRAATPGQRPRPHAVADHGCPSPTAGRASDAEPADRSVSASRCRMASPACPPVTMAHVHEPARRPRPVRRLPRHRHRRGAEGVGGRLERTARRRARDAPLAGGAHDDRHVGRRRLPARHGRGRLQVEPRRSASQGGLCFGVSLILGGLFFARRMRRVRVHDADRPVRGAIRPARGRPCCRCPPCSAEVFWSAELLVALGSTFGVHARRADLTTAILRVGRSSSPPTRCSAACGRSPTPTRFSWAWSRSASSSRCPSCSRAVGGLDAAWLALRRGAAGGRVGLLPPSPAGASVWTPRVAGQLVGRQPDADAAAASRGTATSSACCRARRRRSAQWHSILSGLLTIALTVPPLLLGVAAFAYRVAGRPGRRSSQRAAGRHAAAAAAARSRRRWVALLGHGRHHRRRHLQLQRVDPVGRLDVRAGTACTRLLRPDLSVAAADAHHPRRHRGARRAAATVMALEVQSVQALWFFTSDLVFVLLFPQLVFALFDRKCEPDRVDRRVRRSRSSLRLGGGEPLFGIAADHPVSARCFAGRASRNAAELVRCRRRAAVSLQDACGAAPAPSPCRRCRG
ncbi:MAG: hypothetical protein MZV63_56625 [Marinilabiliales bacterium]|nr:hypothetical protein [Marinilabiliales bacterium]